MNISRVFPAFSVAAAIVYLMSMAFHPFFTLFTYAPRLGQWFMGVPALPANQAPGMYWFSWLTTGLLAGIVAGGISLAAPDSVRSKVWSGWTWVVPVVLTLILTYLERTWFGFK